MVQGCIFYFLFFFVWGLLDRKCLCHLRPKRYIVMLAPTILNYPFDPLTLNDTGFPEGLLSLCLKVFIIAFLRLRSR